jgi:hypothetical protein
MLEACPPFHVFERSSIAVDHAFAIARDRRQFRVLCAPRSRSAVCYAVESNQE